MSKRKTCQSCGREIAWRKKWENEWDEIRYCSAACRKAKPKASDRQLEESILKLLANRACGTTICPSEAAREVFPGDQWRERMEQARRAARRLVARDRLEILQKGRPVDPSAAKGPIRLRLK